MVQLKMIVVTVLATAAWLATSATCLAEFSRLHRKVTVVGRTAQRPAVELPPAADRA